MKNFKFVITLFLFYSVISQEITTEISVHYPKMRDLLIQDIKESKKNLYRLAVLFNDDSDSKENADDIYQLLKGDLAIISDASGKELEIFKVEYKSKSKLYIETSNRKIDFMYICQEFDEEDIPRIKFVADKNKILSFTAVEEYFELGVSVSVLSVNNSLINLQFNDNQLIKERPEHYQKIKNIAYKQ